MAGDRTRTKVVAASLSRRGGAKPILPAHVCLDQGRYGFAAARIAPRSPMTPPIVPGRPPKASKTTLTTPATIALFIKFLWPILGAINSAAPRTTSTTRTVVVHASSPARDPHVRPPVRDCLGSGRYRSEPAREHQQQFMRLLVCEVRDRRPAGRLVALGHGARATASPR